MNLQEECVLHTLHIISVDKNNKPEMFGCGCLIFFRNHYFVLTAAHIKKTEKSKMVLILHNFPFLKAIPNWYIINPTLFKSYKLIFPIIISKFIIWVNKKLGCKKDVTNTIIKYNCDIDFALSEVILPFMPIVCLPINSSYAGRPYKYFNYESVKDLNTADNYYFYGLLVSREPLNNKCEEIFINNMKYIKTKGFYNIFKIEGDNRNLKGCSGTPILNEKGELVSLLVKRASINRHIVYGINLKKVETALHIEVNNITGEEIYG